MFSHIREEHRLKVFKNKALKRIFGSRGGLNRKLEKTTGFSLFTECYWGSEIKEGETGGNITCVGI
jgi:hypothetical protein